MAPKKYLVKKKVKTIHLAPVSNIMTFLKEIYEMIVYHAFNLPNLGKIASFRVYLAIINR